MTRLIDSINPETIMRVAEIICVIGFAIIMLGLTIIICVLMLRYLL